ncbi:MULTISPECIES: XrtA-associated tyrosine autokinase [Thioalkalivibrio]|uniref:non-specific protein-tyrosine kinase n=1 Tax=Thioalkalivibrio halophilus TaxID=252474 RepID=A0A1V3A2A7_9GAMM|nr:MULTISPECIES: XrtA-associated tyrosine autokinase [Thioalkalivibrio]OOC11429.1 protein tyrosine kinase [Thioalkalivibrio halophilus]
MSIIEKALDKSRTRPRQGTGSGDERSAPFGVAAPAPEPSRSKQVHIDFAWLRKQGIVIPGEERSSIAEEFRIMKRPLLNNAFGRHSAMQIPRGRLIMVTSALPREGKTFTATNLALSIAQELDRTVLLVDADVARPAIPITMGFEADRGLMDVLTDPGIDLPDVLLRTNLENLTILPAGRPHGRSTEILASDVMMRLINDLHERYDDRVILFDSPPLLATSEPGVLASHMGQVIMVVDADRTPAASVEQAMEQLQSCDVVLSALNRAPALPGLGYYYGGSYYHGREHEVQARAGA